MAETTGPDSQEGVAQHAVDDGVAERLWAWSEEQIGTPVPT